MATPMVESRAWTANRTLALIIGIVFTILGIVGLFIAPGMRVRSLLGFDIDVVHSIFHLITGLLGLIAAFTGWPRLFNQIFGVIYLILGLAGLIYPGLYARGMFLGIMHMNAADHVLHLITGIIATFVGYFVHDYYREQEPVTAPAERGHPIRGEQEHYRSGQTNRGEGRLEHGVNRAEDWVDREINRGEGHLNRGEGRIDRGEGHIDHGPDRGERY